MMPTTDESATCALCGCDALGAARFVVGRWLCRECVSGTRPPVAMPPNEHQREVIRRWIAPRGARS